MADQLPPAQPGVVRPLRDIIDFAIKGAYAELQDLSRVLPDRQDEQDRKQSILEYLLKTRQLFVRLLVLVKWSRNQKTILACWERQAALNDQEQLYRLAADSLFYYNLNLWQKRAPLYALPTAIDVLTTGTYRRLPGEISLFHEEVLGETAKLETFLQINDVVGLRLMHSKLPKGISTIRIAGGRVFLKVNHEFECTLTLDGPDTTSRWLILTLKVDIAIDVLDVEGTQDPEQEIQGLSEEQLQEIKLGTQHRLDLLTSPEDQPLVALYDMLHYTCIVLQLDYLGRQAEHLLQSRWRQTVQMYFQPGIQLTLCYWLGREATRDSYQAEEGNSDSQRDGASLTSGRYCVQIVVEPSSERPGTFGPLKIRHHPPLEKDWLKIETAPGVEDLRTPHGLCLESVLSKTIILRSQMRLQGLAAELLRPGQCYLENGESDVTLITLAGRDATTATVRLIVHMLPEAFISVQIDPRTGNIILGEQPTPVVDSALLDQLGREVNKQPKSIGHVIGQLRQHTVAHWASMAALEAQARPLLNLPLTEPLTMPPAVFSSSSASGNQSFPATPEPRGEEREDVLSVFVAYDQCPYNFLCITITSQGSLGYYVITTKGAAEGTVLLDVVSTTPLAVSCSQGYSAPDTPLSLIQDMGNYSEESAGFLETDGTNTPGNLLDLKAETVKKSCPLSLQTKIKQMVCHCRLQLCMEAVRQELATAGVLCVPRVSGVQDLEEDLQCYASRILVPCEIPSGPSISIKTHSSQASFKGNNTEVIEYLQIEVFDPVVASWAWQVEIGLKATPVTGKQVSANNHAVYDMKSNTLILRYATTSTTDCAAFLADWHRITMTTTLVSQYLAFQAALEQGHPLATFGQLATTNWLSLQVVYGDTANLYTVEIQWLAEKRRLGTVFGGGALGDRNPHTVMSVFLESELNTNGADMTRFMQALYRSYLPLLAVQRTVAESAIVPFSPPEQSGLPFSSSRTASMVLHTASSVRLVMGVDYAIDVSFAADHYVTVQDVNQRLVEEGAEDNLIEGQKQYKKIPLLHLLIKQHAAGEPLWGEFEVPDPPPEDTGGGLVPRHVVTRLIPAIKRYCGHWLKVKESIEFLAKQGEARHVLDLWSLTHATAMKISSNGIMFKLAVRRNGMPLFQIYEAADYQYFRPAEHNPALDFFFQRATDDASVHTLTHSASVYKSIFYVLYFKANNFFDWIELMCLQKSGRCVHSENEVVPQLALHLHTRVPPALRAPGMVEGYTGISYDEATEVAKFVVRLIDKATLQYVDVGLVHDMQSNTLRGWDHDGSDETLSNVCPASKEIAMLNQRAVEETDVSALRLSWIMTHILNMPFSAFQYPSMQPAQQQSLSPSKLTAGPPRPKLFVGRAGMP